MKPYERIIYITAMVALLTVYFIEQITKHDSELATFRENHFLLRRNAELERENATFRWALDSAKIVMK